MTMIKEENVTHKEAISIFFFFLIKLIYYEDSEILESKMYIMIALEKPHKQHKHLVTGRVA